MGYHMKGSAAHAGSDWMTMTGRPAHLSKNGESIMPFFKKLQAPVIFAQDLLVFVVGRQRIEKRRY